MTTTARPSILSSHEYPCGALTEQADHPLLPGVEFFRRLDVVEREQRTSMLDRSEELANGTAHPLGR